MKILIAAYRALPVRPHCHSGHAWTCRLAGIVFPQVTSMCADKNRPAMP